MLHELHSLPQIYGSTETLALKHPFSRDAAISFDEASHVYEVVGREMPFISVSTVSKEFFPNHFHALLIAGNMFRNGVAAFALKYPRYEYLTHRDVRPDDVPETKASIPYDSSSPMFFHDAKVMTQRLVDTWAVNAALQSGLGTRLHNFIELWYNNPGMDVPEIAEYKQFEAYAKYMAEQGFSPYRTELKMYTDAPLNISGMTDMLYKHDLSGTFHMADWKRSKEIHMDNPRKKGVGPCSHLPDTNHSHYSVSLNLYKYILETFYDIPIADMRLVILHPNQDTFREIMIEPAPEMTRAIIVIMTKKHIAQAAKLQLDTSSSCT